MQLVEKAISSLTEPPIVVRLSGHVQTNDRLAIREIARQLAEQTGRSLLPAEDDANGDDEENPFLDHAPTETVIALPPPSHLLALISVIPTLARPTVLVIDAIDLFALHARQSLLYCLLDTVQSCRAGRETKGVAVIGVTTRIDTINMLEKRVKSRFSGRMFRTACPPELGLWLSKAREALCAPSEGVPDQWRVKWQASVESFLDDETVVNTLKETFALTRDARVLSRLLVSWDQVVDINLSLTLTLTQIQTIASLKPASPFLRASTLQKAASSQRQPSRYAFLSSTLCLCPPHFHSVDSPRQPFHTRPCAYL